LDRIYLTVLGRAVSSSAFRDQEEAELRSAIYTVLATISVLAAPLDAHSLSQILARTSDKVNKALYGLHSILDIPADPRRPIRLHHASFRDFIVDPSRCDDLRFTVDEKQQHVLLAEHCLRHMGEHLRKDICGLRAPGILLYQIDRCQIERCLTPSLQYACCYWGHHIEQACEMFWNFDSILTFLHQHLLHWLETLSLLGRLHEAVHVLRSLEQHTVSDCVSSEALLR
jgi:hypothetical protein